MKIPGIWHKNLEKTCNLGQKTLRKPGICYLEKRETLISIMVSVQSTFVDPGFFLRYFHMTYTVEVSPSIYVLCVVYYHVIAAPCVRKC